jgi:hypothetical protein
MGRTFGFFMKKRHKLFAIAGALIIFITFIFKEGVREQLKDLTDSISEGEKNYNERRVEQETAEKVDNLSKAMQELEDKSDHKKQKQRYYDESGNLVDADEQRNEEEHERVTELMHSVSNLFTDLKIRGEHRTEFDEQLSKISGIDAANDKYINAHSIHACQAQIDPNEDTGCGWSDEEIIDAGNNLNIEMGELSQDTLELASKVLQEQEQRRIRLKHFYDLFTWVSYGLYTFGWGLGFVGRLYGLPEAAGGD